MILRQKYEPALPLLVTVGGEDREEEEAAAAAATGPSAAEFRDLEFIAIKELLPTLRPLCDEAPVWLF